MLITTLHADAALEGDTVTRYGIYRVHAADRHDLYAAVEQMAAAAGWDEDAIEDRIEWIHDTLSARTGATLIWRLHISRPNGEPTGLNAYVLTDGPGVHLLQQVSIMAGTGAPLTGLAALSDPDALRATFATEL